ncbi:unnamed protein product [Angiostrongylus costaricensis]|uniref:Ovule protein n=1 Tax=Angiostrongylus costaricensis TaxID=334426 RepID=A0A0R3PHM5_ANGCS|nr:unnamed protein product [Angiostrongylus costaricensis]
MISPVLFDNLGQVNFPRFTSSWCSSLFLFSTLVICGKASNFILFCLGSKHFRLRLIKLTRRKVHRKMDIKKLLKRLHSRSTVTITVKSLYLASILMYHLYHM